MKIFIKISLLFFLLAMFSCQNKKQFVITAFALDDSETGQGEELGTIIIKETDEGLLFIPRLHNLDEGHHGFHIHANPSLAPLQTEAETILGWSAGEYLNTNNAVRHGLPDDPATEIGTLSNLYADENGDTPFAILSPRLKHLSEIQGHSLIIEETADDYGKSDDTSSRNRIIGAVIKEN